jgi:PIN domain nuclease of toxin-antitoxin system
MKYLLDTNIWILMVENHQSIPLKLMSTILKPDNYPFYISAISVWFFVPEFFCGLVSPWY